MRVLATSQPGDDVSWASQSGLIGLSCHDAQGPAALSGMGARECSGIKAFPNPAAQIGRAAEECVGGKRPRSWAAQRAQAPNRLRGSFPPTH
jgi:hypothetical protein